MTDALVLQPGRTRQLDLYWADGDLDQAARDVAGQLLGDADVLPLTVFLGARVFPIAVWDHMAVRIRLEHLRPPMLDRDEVVTRHSDLDWPSVLRIVGFVGVGRPAAVRRELSGLRAIARTIGLFPRYPSRSALIAEEFDLQGTALTVMGKGGVEVHVGGDGGPRLGSDLSPLWRRAFEERIFAWAARGDHLPLTL